MFSHNKHNVVDHPAVTILTKQRSIHLPKASNCSKIHAATFWRNYQQKISLGMSHSSYRSIKMADDTIFNANITLRCGMICIHHGLSMGCTYMENMEVVFIRSATVEVLLNMLIISLHGMAKPVIKAEI